MIRFLLTVAILIGFAQSALCGSKNKTIVDFTYRMSNYVSLPVPSIESMYVGALFTLPIDDMFAEETDGISELRSEIVDYAKGYIGCRYRSGGKGPKVFDCSGFTSYVFRKFGYELGPASRVQGNQGEHIDFNDAEVGDLMFFSGRRGGKVIGHVGMVINVDKERGQVEFIHASSSQGVVVQKFPDGGYYSKRFLHLRRVI